MVRIKRVFVIIVNYKGNPALLSCLRSVFTSDYPTTEVVVVDNNSKDGSLELAKKQFARVHYIVSGKNRGFSAGVNLGIRFALEKGAEAVLLLNNDAIIDTQTLSHIIEKEEGYGEGIYSPIIQKPNGVKWFIFGKIDWKRFRSFHEKKEQLGVYETTYVPGCCMYITKEIFEKVGLFDEDFFLYYEDVDFCLRAKKEGFPSRVISSISIVHNEASEENIPFKTYHLVLSGEKFFQKHTPWYLLPWWKIFFFLRRIKNQYHFRKDPQNKKILAVRRAFKRLSYEE